MQTMARGKFLFTDGNIFNIEEVFNWQIDRVYGSESRETRNKAPRIQSETIILPQSWFCWGVLYDATTKLHFFEKGVKNFAKVYENTVLEPVVKPSNNTLFSNKHRSLKQDLAPAWKANSTKVWLQGIFHTPLLGDSGWLALQQLWPQPNGIKEWAVLEGMICKKRHLSMEILVKAVVNFPKETLRNAIDGWPQRLRDCVKARDGHFEKWLVLYVHYTCRYPIQ